MTATLTGYPPLRAALVQSEQQLYAACTAGDMLRLNEFIPPSAQQLPRSTPGG